MANWSEILNEIVATNSGPNTDFDGVRLKYLNNLFQLTQRNVIALYSGWLQKQGQRNPYLAISDALMPGLMAAVNKLDKTKGLDLILHTPGGEIGRLNRSFSIFATFSKTISGQSCHKWRCRPGR